MMGPYRDESFPVGKEHLAWVFSNHLERPGISYRYYESIYHVDQRQEDHEESDVLQGRHIVVSGCCLVMPRRRRLAAL